MAVLKEFIDRLAPGEIFATQNVLHLAPRPTLDSAFSRAAKKGILRRLAYGLYMKEGDADRPAPDIPPQEIAELKAKVFRRQLAEHPAFHAAALGLTENAVANQKVYITNGGSTSFRIVGWGRVRLVQRGARHMALGDTRAGQLLRSLWFLGRGALDGDSIVRMIKNAGLNIVELIRRYMNLIPGWLLNELQSCVGNGPPSQI